MYADIEAVLASHIRPSLKSHGGDIELLGVENGIVRFRFLGNCAGCPAADLTNEQLVSTALMEHIPGIKDVVMVNAISDDLISKARELMRSRHEA